MREEEEIRERSGETDKEDQRELENMRKRERERGGPEEDKWYLSRVLSSNQFLTTRPLFLISAASQILI